MEVEVDEVEEREEEVGEGVLENSNLRNILSRFFSFSFFLIFSFLLFFLVFSFFSLEDDEEVEEVEVEEDEGGRCVDGGGG